MWRIVALCLSLLVGRTFSRTSGAPDSTCTDSSLFPSGHGVGAQTVPTPYDITPSDTQYTAGGSLTVTLSGTQSFKGFQIVALPESDDTGAPIGSFEASSAMDTSHVQNKCGSGDNTGLTHTTAFASLTPNRDSIVLKWNAPRSLQGNVVFYVTFVHNRLEFWAKQRSVGIWDGVSAQPSTTTTPSGPIILTDPPSLTTDVTANGCGVTKSCYRDCVENECDFVLTWKKSPGNIVEFELFGALGDSQDYLALGLATDDKMIDVSIVACVADRTRASEVQMYYARDRTGVSRQNTGPISSSNSEAAIKTTDARSMSCRFTYDNNVAKANMEEWKDLDQPLFAFIARGPRAGASIAQHTNIPKISPTAQSFHADEFVDVGGARINGLIKAHACLMVLAWVFCASIGLILARYYKPMWVDNKACGQKVWFSYHRALMLCAMFLTAIAFVLILIDKSGRFVTENDLPLKAHPIIGLIAIICSFLNPLIAAFRCHPGDSKRPIFNWVHWFFGTVAHVFAIVAIFLGMLFTDKAALPSWLIYVMMIFCLFHVCVEFILEIHQCCLYDKNRDRQEEFQMSSKGDPAAQEPKYAGRGFKCAMLAIYLIVVTLLTIAIIAIIAVWGSVSGTK